MLQHGLNFAISSNNIPTTDFITSIETACKLIGPDSEDAAHLRSKCVSVLKQNRIPLSNISKQEREALEELKSNHNIMVLPADKGRTTIIMNTNDYNTKFLDLVNDPKTYKNTQERSYKYLSHTTH